MNDNILVLRDEDGKEIEFEYLDTIEYNNKEFIALLPIEDGDEDEDGEVVILQLVEKDGEDEFLPVEDEKELYDVFDEFKERMKDEFEFVDVE